MTTSDEFRSLLDFDADLAGPEGVMKAVRRWRASTSMSREHSEWFLADMVLAMRWYMSGAVSDESLMLFMMASCIYIHEGQQEV